ncbi:MAG: hypothetical protein H7246_14380 [Phycisphaerae bacterium]|nr:hypothetical protein [Saprospiraceae bacterium]
MRQNLILLSLLAIVGCKKNVEFPPEIRPNEFWARYTITDENGSTMHYMFRGEDTTSLDILSGHVVSLHYFSEGDIQDSVKLITAGLSEFWTGAPISIRLNSPDLLTDPFTPKEWTAAELESLLYPGKTFAFGDAIGEAKLSIEGYPNTIWTCTSNVSSNLNGYFRILEVEDYGAPTVSIPYFGKKVKISFAAPLVHDSGNIWTLADGEAVLLFRYFTF